MDILIVDDEPALAEITADLLASAGYATRIARDGHGALAAIAAQQPELIVLDVNLPDLDGFEIAQRLKTDPATAAIPIIMLSARDGRAARLVGLHSGAEDYLAKPVDASELLAKIRNLLALREHAARDAGDAGT